jgi:dihydrofolate reductase
MNLNHIVCASSNWIIGREGDMPWHLPEDLKHFKKTTMGCPIIMGRKTYESIGRPLPGRLNVILTRDASYSAPDGVAVCTTIDQAIEVARKNQEKVDGSRDEVFIIGGGELYKQTMNLVDKVYLTKIHREISGDTCYGPLDESRFKMIDQDDQDNGKEKYSFITYEKLN